MSRTEKLRRQSLRLERETASGTAPAAPPALVARVVMLWTGSQPVRTGDATRRAAGASTADPPAPLR